MLVICPFPVGVAAGQRLKYEQYFDDWRSLGIDITVSPYADMRLWDVLYRRGHLAAKVAGALRGHLRRLRDLARVHRYDLVYIHMWVTPIGTSLMERIVRRRGRRLIYDLEDNLLVGTPLRRDDNPNPLMPLLKGGGKARFLIECAAASNVMCDVRDMDL